MKKTKKLALSAIFASLGVVLLWVGSLLEVLDMSSAFVVSLAVLFCLVELGTGYAVGVYAVITALSLILLPKKAASLLFALFFGPLPITKMLFEKLGVHIGAFLSYICKIIVFNAELFAFGYFGKELFEIPESKVMIAVYIALFNIIFVLADLLYGQLTRIYMNSIRKRISRFLK